jgi:hypothetical protein
VADDYDLDARHKRVRDMKELLWKALNHDDDPKIGVMACLSVAAQFINHEDDCAESFRKAITYLSRLVHCDRQEYLVAMLKHYPELLNAVEASGNG